LGRIVEEALERAEAAGYRIDALLGTPEEPNAVEVESGEAGEPESPESKVGETEAELPESIASTPGALETNASVEDPAR